MGSTLHDLEIAHGDLAWPIVARFADALLGPSRVGAGAGRAGMAVHALDAVRGPQAAEAMPLHDARVAPSLAGPGHVDRGDRAEEVDGQGLPFADLGRPVLADLPDESLGLGVDFAGMAPRGLRRRFFASCRRNRAARRE